MRVDKVLRGMLMKALALAGLNPWLTCRECVDLVTEFLEGALSPRDRALVLAHLERCPHCPRYIRQIELMIRLVGATATDSDALSPVNRAALLNDFGRHGPRDPDDET